MLRKIKLDGKQIRDICFVLEISLVFSLYSGMCAYSSVDYGTVIQLMWTAFFLWLVFFSLIVCCKKNHWIKIQPVKLKICTDWNVSTKKKFFALFLITCVLWVPAYLAMFPGVLGYDTPGQMYDLLVTGDLNSQHPVLHTLLMSWIIYLVGGLFHNYTVGMAVYSALQAMVLIHATVRLYVFLRRRGVNSIISGGLYAAIVFNPNVQTLAFNATKDVLFAGFFLEFTISIFDLMLDQEYFDLSVKNKAIRLLPITGWGTLFCLFRSQGIYIVFFMVLISLITKNLRKKFLVMFIVIFVVSKCFQLICTYGFDIKQVNSREMYSVPMQQVASVCNKYLEGKAEVNITEEQLSVIEEVIPEEGLRAYDYESADPVKSTFNTDVFKANKGRYLSVYFKVGLQNKRIYLRAFLDEISPYWDMTLNGYRGLAFLYPFTDLNVWNIASQTKAPTYFAYLQRMEALAMYDQIPVLGWIFNPGIWVWILSYIGIYGCFYKKGRLLYVALPIMLYFGTTLLGPIALVRYSLSLIMVVPAIVGYACLKK